MINQIIIYVHNFFSLLFIFFVHLIIQFEKLALKIFFFTLILILILVTSIRLIEFHILAWLKVILLTIEHLLYFLQLCIYLFLSVTLYHFSNSCSFTLFQTNAVDGIATHCEEKKSGNIKIEHLLKSARPPNIYGFTARLYEKLPVNKCFYSYANRNRSLLLFLNLDELIQVVEIQWPLFGSSLLLITQILFPQSFNVNCLLFVVSL